MEKLLRMEEEEKNCLEEGMIVERRNLALSRSNERGLKTYNTAVEIEEELMFASR